MPPSPFKFLEALKPDRSSMGIEITDHSIKISKVLIKPGKTALIQHVDSDRLPVQTMEEGRIKEPLRVIQSLQTMLARMNAAPKYTHLVLPSQLVTVRFLKLPDIPLKDLAKLVDFEIKHHIRLPFDNPLYDFVKLSGTENKLKRIWKRRGKEGKTAFDYEALRQAAVSKESGLEFGSGRGLFDEPLLSETAEAEARQCDVMLVAAPKDLVDEYLEIMKSCNIKVTSMEIKAFSLYRLLLATTIIPIKGTFLIVDLNESAADLSIFRGDQLKITRHVPVHFSSSPAAANDNSSLDNLFAEFSDPEADFRNSCSDLSHELERLMNFYKYSLNNRDEEFEGLVLSGDIPRLDEIKQYLSTLLSVPVSLFQTDELYGLHKGIGHIVPAFAVPLGLALRGSEV